MSKEVQEFIDGKSDTIEMIEKKIKEVWDNVSSFTFTPFKGLTFSEVINGIGRCDEGHITIDGLRLNVMNVKNVLENNIEEVSAFKDYVFNHIVLHGVGSTVADRKSSAYIEVNPLVKLKVKLKGMKNECIALDKKLSNWENMISRNRRDLYNRRKEYQDGYLKASYEEISDNEA